VHQFNAGETEAGITCMGWGSNVTDKTSSTRKSASWDEVLAFDSVISEDKIPLDLPRDLSMIDIERSLPKLSLLPAGGTSYVTCRCDLCLLLLITTREDVFCSRSSLDALFRPFDPKDNSSVDVMIVGTENGKVHVTIYDSFIIGSFPLPSTIGEASSKLLRHSSHSQSSTHSLLIQNSGSDILYVAALDLRFISATSDYLSLLASRSTALQNLLRYIHQVQILMANEWKSTQELPARFIRNVNETLEENAKGDIVQALYHSVATGHTYPAVKEWLVDELQERVCSGY
jgi:anaphase-promoting complex subunit 4